MNKNTYRVYVGGKYHIFKNYKVYFSYYNLKHDERAMLRIYKERYSVCLKNNSLIRMFFGQWDTLDSIKNKLNDLENRIKNNYLYL